VLFSCNKGGCTFTVGAVALQTYCSSWQDLIPKDARNVPSLGRIGDPDDILASVLVQDGKVTSYLSAVFAPTSPLMSNPYIVSDPARHMSTNACIPYLHC